ncbi:hypothetical protein L484_003394 [Morus notabilis]|uniref:Uncharacterized protein n=1 Tax=Morus notabilis TaxID=981085 RepID=W9SI35_9ROSA|nr:hypothetical protein L484_003394 [Morus notabilis]
MEYIFFLLPAISDPQFHVGVRIDDVEYSMDCVHFCSAINMRTTRGDVMPGSVLKACPCPDTKTTISGSLGKDQGNFIASWQFSCKL